MPVVQFSIPAAPWERLEKAVVQGESTNQAAKRLLIQLLLGEDAPAQTPDPDEMDYLKHRLDRLEEIVQLGNAAGPDRLDNLEERLEKLESELKSLALQFSERVYELSQKQTMDLCPLNSAVENLEKMAFSMQVALESRLSEIERRLDSTPSAALAAVPSPTRLPKATKRKTQETPENTP